MRLDGSLTLPANAVRDSAFQLDKDPVAISRPIAKGPTIRPPRRAPRARRNQEKKCLPSIRVMLLKLKSCPIFSRDSVMSFNHLIGMVVEFHLRALRVLRGVSLPNTRFVLFDGLEFDFYRADEWWVGLGQRPVNHRRGGGGVAFSCEFFSRMCGRTSDEIR